MKRVFFIFIPLIIALSIIGGVFVYLNKSLEKGALQVTSIPKSNVYLNGKLIGQTPVCKCEFSEMISVGEHMLRLVPLSAGLLPFEEKIKISKSILTAVDRTFEKDNVSSGSIVTLNLLDNKKDIELLVISIPEKADVFLDSAKVGQTPLLLKDVTDSDHTLNIRKTGYNEKALRIHTVLGYKLLATVFLGIDKNDLNKATDEANLKGEQEISKEDKLKIKKVVILDTPTGFLRVRNKAILEGLEIDRVYSGESYDLISENNGWYEIKTKSGKQGFVSGQYSEVK